MTGVVTDGDFVDPLSAAISEVARDEKEDGILDFDNDSKPDLQEGKGKVPLKTEESEHSPSSSPTIARSGSPTSSETRNDEMRVVTKKKRRKGQHKTWLDDMFDVGKELATSTKTKTMDLINKNLTEGSVEAFGVISNLINFSEKENVKYQIYPWDLGPLLHKISNRQKLFHQTLDLDLYIPAALRHDLDDLKHVYHFLKLANGSYGYKLIFAWMYKGDKGDLKAAVKNPNAQNKKALLYHTSLKEDDLVLESWDTAEFKPAHYIALDHKTRSVVLAIRGSMSLSDVVTDVVAEHVPFLHGTAHAGMARTAWWFMEEVVPIFKKTCEQYPDYKPILCGHSLGAAVASLVTVLVRPEMPNAYCYAFATPAVLDVHLASETQTCVESWVYGDDIVPQMSVAAMTELKMTVVEVAKEGKHPSAYVKRDFDRTMQEMRAAKAKIMGWFSKKKADREGKSAPSATKDGEHEEEKDSAGQANAGVEKLFPPGKVRHIFRVPLEKIEGREGCWFPSDGYGSVGGDDDGDDSNKDKKKKPLRPRRTHRLLAIKSDPALFSKILLTRRMMTDHFPDSYERGFERLIRQLGGTIDDSEGHMNEQNDSDDDGDDARLERDKDEVHSQPAGSSSRIEDGPEEEDDEEEDSAPHFFSNADGVIKTWPSASKPLFHRPLDTVNTAEEERIKRIEKQKLEERNKLEEAKRQEEQKRQELEERARAEKLAKQKAVEAGAVLDPLGAMIVDTAKPDSSASSHD